MLILRESVKSVSGVVKEEVSYDTDIKKGSLYDRVLNEIKKVEYKKYLLCKLPPHLWSIPFKELPFNELKDEKYFFWN